MQTPNLPMVAGGQQLNLAALQAMQQGRVVTLPTGQQVVIPAGNLQQLQQQQLQQQQQLALLQQQALNPQAQALLAGNRLPMNAIQQQQFQQQHALQLQQRQQHLLALQRQQAAQQQQSAAAAAAAAAARPQVPQVPAQPLPQMTANFTPDQLETLRLQIVVFKKHKRGDKVMTEELANCKPKPLPAALQPRPAQVALPPGAAVAAAQAAAVRPAGAAGLPLQGIRPQLAAGVAALTANRPAAAANAAVRGAAAAGAAAAAAAAAAGRVTPQAGRPGGDGAVAVKAEPPPGPSHPPMDEPVRRPAGPVLSLLPAPEVPPPGGLPTLNVDVPRLLRVEYHKRMQAARMRRQHELENLLKSGKLPVGHCRAPDGTPGRAAVLMELKKLRLFAIQSKMRAELEREQMEIGQLPDKPYKQMQKNAQKYQQTLELQQQQEQHQRWGQLMTERLTLKKPAAEKLLMFKEMHSVRGKYLARMHERLARELQRQRMGDADRRLDALRQNDFEAYKELLRQTHGPQTDDDRFKEVDEFLQQTEKYIKDLTHRLVNFRAKEEAQEAAQEAMAEARMAELTEEEAKLRAETAQQERLAANELLSEAEHMQGDAQSTLTAMAHNVTEKIIRAPAYLKPPGNGKLRDYQMMGLEWMVSLYNNKLNGILADEMGLGKTVQVMALLAYLYEFKQNYGPHLIIVPNAVMVNWKAELQTWLPAFRCVYYTGSKDDRAVKFQQEVQSMQFNILVTTYETIMRDRNKLSKLEWKYIIIDEAQRMKDRESKLSQDLNKFTTARRLLLTGTPLQNELKELWSLLNLLLPDVFNEQQAFTDWFSRFLGDADGKQQSAGGGGGGAEASAMDREKRILVVNRLHQILSPFMLRRMVKDVEQQLPEKITITVKCPMSAYQCAVYNWIKATNTVRVDPQHRRVAHGHRAWEPLQNKVMELRKVCNHPRLCYADSEHFWEQNVVRTCGKMYWLDQILVKLYSTGHRVLLFSTMTRMLDTVEFYLNWRKVAKNDGSGEQVLMKSRRIDGSTPLESREIAIREFNAPDSDVFIFLLSIRAAGRGLNLQTADTVIIYDPDPNPKNEEQAIARSHRIGQTKEVRVLHLEAVADPAAQTHSFPPDQFQPRRSGPQPGTALDPGVAPAAAAADQGDGGGSSSAQLEEQPSQQVMFADSIESLMRNVIQKQKIDMANEVIDAGSFDNLTNDAERRQKLEAMLLDEERLKTSANEAPSLASFNRQLARSDAEFARFQQMDKDKEAWPGELMVPSEVPDYLHFTSDEVREVLKITERKPARVGIMAQAERRQQEQQAQAAQAAQAAATAAAATAAGAAGKPPVAPRPAAGAAAAAGGGGVRPSQSMVSLHAAGTSFVSGQGEDGEGEEEVVGGAYDDIEEEVVDDRNIDEEFERQLEQEDQPGSQARASSRDGTPGKQQQQQQQRGSTPQSAVPGAAAAAAADAAGASQPQSPFAALHVQQPQQQQQLTPSKADGGMRVTFADQQQQGAGAAGAAAGAGPPPPAAPQADEEMWEDVAAPAAAAVVAPQASAGQPDAAHALQQQQDWQHWQQQQNSEPGANGAYQQQQQDGAAGQKRPWAQAAGHTGSQGVEGGDGAHLGAAGGGGPAAAGQPAASGGGPTSSYQPSLSTGGQTKKIRLKMKGTSGGSNTPAP